MSALPTAADALDRSDYLDLETAGFRVRGVSQMLHALAASTTVPDHLQSALANMAYQADEQADFIAAYVDQTCDAARRLNEDDAAESGLGATP